MKLSVKMEELLDICQARRELHVDYLREVRDPRCSAEQPEADNLIVFNDNDMVRIMNTWRKDVGSYMRPATLWQYQRDLKFNPERLTAKARASTAYIFSRSLAASFWCMLSYACLCFPNALNSLSWTNCCKTMRITREARSTRRQWRTRGKETKNN